MLYIVRNKKTNLFVIIDQDAGYNHYDETNDIEKATIFKNKDCTDLRLWTKVKKDQHHLVTLLERTTTQHDINIDDYEILDVVIKLI